MFAIIVITPETTHQNEVELLHSLVKEYNCTIHIRKPNFSLEEYREYLQSLNQLLPHFVLHEHHSLAKVFPVKGVHLKERDRNNGHTKDSNVKVISTSLHKIEDAANLVFPFEYVFYSPLFKSISKENYGINTSEKNLAETITEIPADTEAEKTTFQKNIWQ